MSPIDRAIHFASNAHADQVRDGVHPLPYITHPIDVLNKLRYIGNIVDSDLLVAAVLHDVVEECPISIDQIQSEFGKRVGELVDMVTRTEPSSEVAAQLSKEALWDLRSNMLLSEIATRMDADAHCIKLADRLSNLEGAKVTKAAWKYERYREQTKQMLKIIPASVSPSLWNAVRKQSGWKKAELC